MKTSILKRIGGACMALALGCAMTLGLATTSKAALIDGAYVEGNDARITKNLKMTTETQLPTGGLTFEFEFKKVSYNTESTEEAKNKMPDIGPVEIEINGSTETKVEGGIKTYTEESRNFLHDFAMNNGTPDVGTYIYEVTETGLGGDTLPTNGHNKNGQLIFSKETYTVEIYVREHANGTNGQQVLTVVKNEEGTKVDPTPGAHGMAFNNTYIKTVLNNALTISKEVEDAMGNGNAEKFDFTLKIGRAAIMPENATPITYTINGANETPIEFDTEINFELGNGDSLQVNGLVVGTPYEITEGGVEGWTATYKINGQATQSGTAGEGLTIANQKIQDQENTVAITNTFNSQTPTGILMNNLPFSTMVVLGVGALTLVAVTNVRKRTYNA